MQENYFYVYGYSIIYFKDVFSSFLAQEYHSIFPLPLISQYFSILRALGAGTTTWPFMEQTRRTRQHDPRSNSAKKKCPASSFFCALFCLIGQTSLVLPRCFVFPFPFGSQAVRFLFAFSAAFIIRTVEFADALFRIRQTILLFKYIYKNTTNRFCKPVV